MKCFNRSSRRRAFGLAAVVATPAALQAQVVYSGAQNLTVNSDNAQQIDFEFTLDHETKGGETPTRQESLYFTVTALGESKGGESKGGESKGGDYDFRVYSDSDGIELLGTSPTPDMLSFGSAINYSSSFFNTATSDAGVLSSLSWTTGSTGFLGFRIPATNGSEPNFSYAWVQLNVSTSSSFTVVDWAYQDSLGDGITAGAVPEPHTTALAFALVALAAVGWRRWRVLRPKRYG